MPLLPRLLLAAAALAAWVVRGSGASSTLLDPATNMTFDFASPPFDKGLDSFELPALPLVRVEDPCKFAEPEEASVVFSDKHLHSCSFESMILSCMNEDECRGVLLCGEIVGFEMYSFLDFRKRDYESFHVPLVQASADDCEAIKSHLDRAAAGASPGLPSSSPGVSTGRILVQLKPSENTSMKQRQHLSVTMVCWVLCVLAFAQSLYYFALFGGWMKIKKQLPAQFNSLTFFVVLVEAVLNLARAVYLGYDPLFTRSRLPFLVHVIVREQSLIWIEFGMIILAFLYYRLRTSRLRQVTGLSRAQKALLGIFIISRWLQATIVGVLKGIYQLPLLWIKPIWLLDATIFSTLVLVFSYNAVRLPIELSRNLDDRRERRKVQRRIIFCWLAVLFLFGTYAIEHLPLERVRSHYIWLLLAQTLALQLTSWAVVNNFSSPWEKSRRHSLSKASRRSSQCTLDQSHAHAGIVTLPRGTQLRVPGVRVNVRSPKTPHGSSEAKSQTNTHTRTHTRRSSRSQVLMFPRSPPCRIAEFAEIKRHRRMSSRGMASVSVSMYEGGAGTPERPSDFESIKELHVNKKAAVHLRFPEAEALPDHLG